MTSENRETITLKAERIETTEIIARADASRQAPEETPRACCGYHDGNGAPCAPDDQGGYCCDNCPTLAATGRTGSIPRPQEVVNPPLIGSGRRKDTWSSAREDPEAVNPQA